ncbi:hepatocyte nuclear factor 6 isoform X4 [Chironomus tepperi]|uniref:hepatocyte nuclear factor 6 isoform X4 n=1 Tax=Chironomus tepperi TaxID=113505 RepID=UPI00391F54F6
METIEEIIEQEIAEPLVEEAHHTHHIQHRTHRHHHNGSIVMVNTQTGHLIHRGGHEMNNNEQLDHQRGRIITHASQVVPGLDMVKQEHPCVDVDTQLDHHSSQQHHHQKQETLSVIVQPHDDSRDSQILSPGSGPCTEIIDASDFRAMNEPTYQTLTSVNGRMSPPGFSPNSSYATLTPLQPLPPISTMSDKFAYGHGHGLGVNSPYTYDKSPSMDISPPHSYSPIPQSIYSQNGLPSPQKSMSPGYESPYHRDLLASTPTSVRQNGNGNGPNLGDQASPASPPHSYSPIPDSIYNGIRQNGSNGQQQQNISITTSAPSPTLSAQSAELHSPVDQQMDKLWNGKMMESPSNIHHNGSQTGFVQIGGNGGQQQQQQQPQQHHLTSQQPHHHHNQNNRELLSGSSSVSPIPPMIQRSENTGSNSNTTSGAITTKSSKLSSSSLSLSNDVEEINTKELAQRISAELKRYSIPQAIFAQRVLCRSQGTLSDLLRNPKPWSKLKSGRETFRRMAKWLQEPEYQRMSALRLAAAQIPQRGNGAGCKRKEEPDHVQTPKKPRLVFTDLQRRTLQAIFKETKRPSKEMVVTIARQLCLQATTVGNFFMNSRRRSSDKWQEESHDDGDDGTQNNDDDDDDTGDDECQMDAVQQQATKQQIQYHLQQHHAQQQAAQNAAHDEM